MGKWWNLLRGEIIGGLIVSALLAIASGIWALLQSWVAPIIIPLVIGVFALSIFAINQLHSLLTRRQIKNLERFVTDTFYKLGVSIKRDSNNNAVFQVTVTKGEDGVTITQNKSSPEYLTLCINIAVAEKDRQELDMVTSQRPMIIQDLRIEMNRFGVMYRGLKHPLRLITLVDIVPSLNLSESDLLYSLERVRRARRLMENLILKELQSMQLNSGIGGSHNEQA
jgi:hypothetical protein